MNKIFKDIKQILILFCALFGITQLIAQTPDVIVPTGDLTGTSNTRFPGRDGVRMIPGATRTRFAADANHTFKAWIDQSVTVPLEQFGWTAPMTVDARPFNSNLPVGTTVGSIDVSSIGSAVYNIPIFTSPGTAGMAPKISVTYNSALSNGIMGAGWDISGLSSISRIRKDQYHDNSFDDVKFDATDNFALDGNRLISIGNNQYRTEVETFSVITVTSSNSSGPLAFKVETKDGLIYEYGASTEDENAIYKHSSDANKIISWYIRKVSDQFGNYYKFTYVNNRAEGEFRISKIDYTYNDNTGLVGYNSMVFAYISKPNYQITNTYKYGSFVSDKMLLQEIRIFNEESIAHKYKFNYTNEDTYPHLIEIQEFGTDGSRYNSTVLNYNTLKTSGYACSSTGVLPGDFWGDFDGDGIDQKAQLHPVIIWDENHNTQNYNIYVQIDNKNASSPYTEKLVADNIPLGTYAAGSCQFTDESKYNFKGLSFKNDFNGDGFFDLLFKENVGNVTTFSPFEVSPIVNQESTTYNIVDKTPFSITNLLGDGLTIDFNKDGLTDFLYLTLIDTAVVGIVNNGVTIGQIIKQCSLKMRKSTPNSPFSDEITIASSLIFVTNPFYNSIVVPSLFNGDLNIYPLDYNGDGLMDFILNKYLFINTGSGFTSQVISSTCELDVAMGFKEVSPVDINGDGLSDFYAESQDGTKKFYTSTGVNGAFITSDASFLFQEGTGTNIFHRFGDFNGDGKTDFLYNVNITQPSGCNTRGHIRILFNKNFGSGFYEPSNDINNGAYYILNNYCDPAFLGILTVQDITLMNIINNDDVPELYIKYNSDVIKKIELQASNTLSEISNGIDQRIKINYTGSGKGYTPSVTPIISASIPVYTVKSIQTGDGIGGYKTTNYSFSDPKMHFQGNGFVGYMKMTKSTDNAIDGSLTTRVNEVNKFKYSIADASNNMFYYAYPDQKEVGYDFINSQNEIISKPISKVECLSNIYNFGNKRYFPYLSQVTNHDYLWSEYTDASNAYTEVVSQSQFNYSSTDVVNGNMTSAITTKGTSVSTVLFNSYGAYGSPIPNKYTEKVTTLQKDGLDDQTSTDNFNYLSNGVLNFSLLRPGIGDPNAPGTSLQSVKTNYTYNAYGLPTSVTVWDVGISPATTTSIIEYDLKYRFAVKNTNALGHITEATYDSKYGNVLTSKDANGLITAYKYDGLGRMIETTAPDGITVKKELHFGNHNSSPSLVSIAYYSQTITPGTSDFIEGYDKLGRLVRTVKFFGYGALKDVTTNYYNTCGQLVQKRINSANTNRLVSVSQYDPFFRPKSVEEFTGPTSDPASLSSSSLTATNNLIQYSYTGLSVATNDNGKTTTKTITPTGLLATVVDNMGSLISYTYNSANQVTEISSVGATTIIAYDRYGRQKTITEPNTGITTFSYNGLSQITSQQDAKGNLYVFTYDKLGRVLTKSETASGTSTPVVTNYTYDTEANGKGGIALISGGDNGFTTTYKYDALSRNYKVIENNSGKVLTTTCEFDEYGRVKKVKYPSNTNSDGSFYVNYNYNTFSVLDKITDPNNNTIWQLQSQNLNGSCKEVKLGPNGNMLKTNTYTNYGTPDIGKMNYSGTTPWENKWTYVINSTTRDLDSRNNTLTVNGSATRNLMETFYYDDLDRLEYVYQNMGQGPVLNQTMSYNLNGKIEGKTDVGTYQYPDVQHYSATGIQNSPTPLTIQSLIEYTPFNKMKTVAIENGSATNKYQQTLTYGFDNERRKTIDQYSTDGTNYTNVRTKYYGQNYELVTQGSTTKELHYIVAPDGLAAIYEIKNGMGTMYYTQTDYQGSLVMVVKADGSRVNDLSYDAWGNRRNPNTWALKTATDFVAELNTPTLITDRGYTLHEHMDTYGLINMNGRAYDQRLGQFLSADPFVHDPTNTQNYNRYAYCLNNPMKYTDPSGYRISGNNNYWGQNGSNADPVTYSVDNVTVSRTEYILNGGDRVAVFHGNIGWQGSDGGYCMLEFYYSVSASTVNFAYQVGTKTIVTPDSWGNNTRGKEPVYDYKSYTFQPSKTSSNETLGFIIGCASLGYDFFENNIYNGDQYIPTKGPNKGILTSVWKMTKNGDFVLKNGSKVPNSLNALSKIKITNAVKTFGIALNAIGLGLTTVDIYQNGLNISNGSDFIFGCVAFIPPYGWVVSGVYFVGKECYKSCNNSSNTKDYLRGINSSIGGFPIILFK